MRRVCQQVQRNCHWYVLTPLCLIFIKKKRAGTEAYLKYIVAADRLHRYNVMFKKDIKRVVKLAEAGAELCASIFTGVIPTMVMFAEGLLILVAVALVLVGLRVALIALAPKLAKSSKVVAAAVNVFMDVFAVLIETFKIAIYAIELAIEVLSFGAYRPKSIAQALRFPKPISANEIVTFSNICATTCPSINSIGHVFDFLAPQMFHNSFCPVLRATKPITALGPTLQALLGWGVEGGYETMPGDNCRDLESLYPKSTCVIIAIGIIIAEFFIPLLLVGILLKSSGSIVWRLLVAIVENLLTLVEIAYKIIEVAVKLLNLAPTEKHTASEKTKPLMPKHAKKDKHHFSFEKKRNVMESFF